jgi:hypothetical protein
MVSLTQRCLQEHTLCSVKRVKICSGRSFEEIGHYTLNRSLSGINFKVPPRRISMVCDREAAGISWVLFQMASDG